MIGSIYVRLKHSGHYLKGVVILLYTGFPVKISVYMLLSHFNNCVEVAFFKMHCKQITYSDTEMFYLEYFLVICIGRGI